jgi:tRNA(Ile)-lysidine synthetase-like protein
MLNMKNLSLETVIEEGMEFKKNSLNKFEYQLLEKLLSIDRNNKLSEGKILFNLQISGGMDSMCLLHAFSKIINSRLFHPIHEFIVVAQHFNHKKRGMESDEDAAFVLKYCLQVGIPFYQETLDSSDFIGNENFQNYARRWRKSKASELCNHLKVKHNCNNHYIVTAHHARDHVESVLMHVLRGCSLNGLIGIQEFDDQKIYYRPFYNIEYEKIGKYCVEEKIKFRLDSSNLNDEYERNYIRNHILPHFKKLKNTYEKSFQSMSSHVQEHLELVSSRKDLQKNKKIVILKGMALSKIYELFITKDRTLSEVLSRNVMMNILHEAKLLREGGGARKEIKLGEGWIVQLNKGNDNIEIDVFQKKTIK